MLSAYNQATARASTGIYGMPLAPRKLKKKTELTVVFRFPDVARLVGILESNIGISDIEWVSGIKRLMAKIPAPDVDRLPGIPLVIITCLV